MKQAMWRKAAIVLALVVGFSGAGASAQEITVARIGQEEVSVGQVRAMLPELTLQQRETLGNNPAVLKQAVQAALLQEMLVQAALRSHWDADPSAAHAIKRARNAALAESYLDAVAAVPAGYPQENEVRAVYEANLSQLMQPRQMQLAQIFVADSKAAADSAGTSAAKAKLKAVADRLGKQPSAETFANVARDYSDETASAQNGGSLGWLTLEHVLPELRDALQNAAEGSVVGPLRLAGGWHWLRCNAVKEAEPVSFESVRAALAERMRAERMQANRQAYLARLLAQNPISINELALIQLVRSDSANAAGANGVPENDAPVVRFVNKP